MGRPRKLKGKNILYVSDDIFAFVRAKKKPKQIDEDVLREIIGEKNIQMFSGSSSKDILYKE